MLTKSSQLKRSTVWGPLLDWTAIPAGCERWFDDPPLPIVLRSVSRDPKIFDLAKPHMVHELTL